MRLVQTTNFLLLFPSKSLKEYYLNICLLYCFATDQGAILYHVHCEKSNGSDDGIYADCCLPYAQINGEHGYAF